MVMIFDLLTSELHQWLLVSRTIFSTKYEMSTAFHGLQGAMVNMQKNDLNKRPLTYDVSTV